MAAVDYCLCFRCSRKAFYDAVISDERYLDAFDPPGFNPNAERIGIAVLCVKCNKTHEVVIRECAQQGEGAAMSDAPMRIWMQPELADAGGFADPAYCNDVEYVRADLLAAALAALDEAREALEYSGRILAALGSPETRLTPIRAVLARIDAIREAETKRPAECVSPRCSIILDPGEVCPVCAGVREAETP